MSFPTLPAKMEQSFSDNLANEETRAGSVSVSQLGIRIRYFIDIFKVGIGI